MTPTKGSDDDRAPLPRENRNRELVRVAYIFICMFFMLVGYLVYFNVIKADEINTNSYNT